jgi:hypothetical protein
MSAGAAGNEDAVKRPPGAQSFDDGMDTNQDGQTSIIPRPRSVTGAR